MLVIIRPEGRRLPPFSSSWCATSPNPKVSSASFLVLKVLLDIVRTRSRRNASALFDLRVRPRGIRTEYFFRMLPGCFKDIVPVGIDPHHEREVVEFEGPDRFRHAEVFIRDTFEGHVR